MPGLWGEVCGSRPSTQMAGACRGGYPRAGEEKMVQRIELTVRRHHVVLTSIDGRWTAEVDGIRIEHAHESSADAWAAAVGASERLDGLAAVARVTHS
jgi:hypothetical protein